MGYLILTRKVDQSIILSIRPGTDPRELLRQIEQDGIVISLVEIKSLTQVKIAVEAPEPVLVLREELVVPNNSTEREFN